MRNACKKLGVRYRHGVKLLGCSSVQLQSQTMKHEKEDFKGGPTVPSLENDFSRDFLKARNRGIKSISVKTFADFLKAVDDLDFANTGWYRGHHQSKWTLSPAIHRNSHDWERTLLVHFRTQAYSRHDRLPSEDRTCHWLCLMQHYGLPTRLLDWSKSPLVALFFALENTKRSDACIWVLFPGKLNNYYKTVAGLLTLRDDTPEKRLEAQLKDVVTAEGSECSILAVAPPEIDKRLFVQQSRFTVHGCKQPLDHHCEAHRFLARIKLDFRSYPNMRKSLRSLGFDRSYLFPDLHNLALDLNDRFSPKAVNFMKPTIKHRKELKAKWQARPSASATSLLTDDDLPF